jgi:SAM-dependent methyltransferase
MTEYFEDLAYVHDSGFTGFVRAAGRGLLDWFRRAGIEQGMVVDLGCGTGLWAASLLRAGYDVTGIDSSRAMIRLARRHAPRARFLQRSILDTNLPPCQAVTAIGEVFNYALDTRVSKAALARLFRRIFVALAPGGLLSFDLLDPQPSDPRSYRTWQGGPDWLVAVEIHEEPARHRLIRRIITFRRRAGSFRRREETHVLRLYKPGDVSDLLKSAGFSARRFAGYGSARLDGGRSVWLARKPPAPSRRKAARGQRPGV